jgi:hypothetical protein
VSASCAQARCSPNGTRQVERSGGEGYAEIPLALILRLSQLGGIFRCKLQRAFRDRSGHTMAPGQHSAGLLG